MAYPCPNESGYADRLKFVHDLFRDTFKLTPTKVDVIAYDKNLPFPYNNFVFGVEIEEQAVTDDNRHGYQPGTAQIPIEHTKFIFRLSNPDSSYNNGIRVENEVAALTLARHALKDSMPDIVPRVFAWRSAVRGHFGWMLQEFMPGEPLMDVFLKLELDSQRKILEQMADVLAAFQRYKIPSSIRGYGGLTFDDAGQIVIGPMSIMKCGPFDSYNDLVRGTIQSKLATADKNKTIVGWTQNDKNIRTRLDKFLSVGFEAMMVQVSERKQALVHGDFSIDNLLYDPATMRITAVFDFDFSHIGTVADDFFRSLGHGIGRFPDPRDGDEMLPLNKAMLTGFPTPLPDANEDIHWPQAKMWDDTLRARGASGVYRPGTIPGIEVLSSLFWLSSQILPFKLSWDFIVDGATPETVRKWKEEGEKMLNDFLTEQGF